MKKFKLFISEVAILFAALALLVALAAVVNTARATTLAPEAQGTEYVLVTITVVQYNETLKYAVSKVAYGPLDLDTCGYLLENVQPTADTEDRVVRDFFAYCLDTNKISFGDLE